jgi:hypothetical protein
MTGRGLPERFPERFAVMAGSVSGEAIAGSVPATIGIAPLLHFPQ